MRWQTILMVFVVVAIAGLSVWLFVPGAAGDVVLYCSVDRDQSEPIKSLFEEQTGQTVDYQPELEAHRSIGLSRRLSEERGSPRADVFWANEIMHTAWLAEAGVLDELPADVLALFPAAWRDPDKRWVAFGLRARVLVVNTELLPDPATWPTSVADLIDPKWSAMGFKVALAAPLTGTTYTHAVALLTSDEAGTRTFFEGAAKASHEGRLQVAPGNGAVMTLVRDAKNKVAFGLTDTDDAWAAKLERFPVEVVYPDQASGQPGTVVIPNTLALVKGRPHPENALKLVRWLAQPSTEERLAASSTAQMPVREGVKVPADGHVKRPGVDFRVREVDWSVVATNRDRWHDYLNGLLRPAR